MTPKERWLAVLNHQKPDCLPTDYWATAEAHSKLLAHLGCQTDRELYTRLHIDRAIAISARYVGPPIPKNGDVFGCGHQTVQYGGGTYNECITHPLAAFTSVDAIEANYVWPSPDWYTYDHLPEQVAQWEGYPIRGGGSEPFLIYKKLRGDVQAFMDLIEHPEIVHYCLDKLFGLAYTNTLRIYETLPGEVDLSYVAEDMGGQESLLFSPNHIRTFLLPRMQRMIKLAHDAGVFVFFHSDGAIHDIIPDMIRLGIDVLNPIQWRCQNMDRETLIQDFGHQLCFHGGVDNQHTLAFGSVADVQAEVRDNIDILNRHNRYILAPCHNIQAVSPPENIVAMYESAHEMGKSI
ncbi:MAG: uroporphyrinogen-III decarboxylase-like protein [bacterium]|nr:uroporphyrinogen-III decarboxylase-like protein [bacterium]